MVATTDGFELAERDLEIRGEGQLLGARQSGLSDLRFTRLRAGPRPARAGEGAGRRARRRAFLGDRGRAAARRGGARRRVVAELRARRPTSVSRCGSSRGTHRGRRIAAPKGAQPGRRATACVRRSTTSSARSTARPCSTSSRARARWGSRRSRAAHGAASSSRPTGAACRVIRENLEKLGLTGGARPAEDAFQVLREERAAGRRLRSRAARPAVRALGGARAAARRGARRRSWPTGRRRRGDRPRGSSRRFRSTSSRAAGTVRPGSPSSPDDRPRTHRRHHPARTTRSRSATST